MKAVLMTIIWIGLFACKSESRKLKSFTPGTYVRAFSHECSTGKVTLLIMPLKYAVYSIERTGRFQQIRYGHLLPVEEKKESWMALFDDKKGASQETTKGRIISFDPDHNRLFVGSSPYQKVRK